MADQPEQKSGGGLSFQTLGISSRRGGRRRDHRPDVLGARHGARDRDDPDHRGARLRGAEPARRSVDHARSPPRVTRPAPATARRRACGAAAPDRPRRRPRRGAGALAAAGCDDDRVRAARRPRRASLRPRPPAGSSRRSPACWRVVIAAGVVTASELAIFGDSVSGDGPHDACSAAEAPTSPTDEDGRRRRRRPTATPQDGEATPTPTATTATPEASRDADADARRRTATPVRRARRPTPDADRRQAAAVPILDPRMAKDQIPTSRHRAHRAGRRASRPGRAAKQMGTRAANVARDDDGKRCPPSSAGRSRRRTRSSTSSGR